MTREEAAAPVLAPGASAGAGLVPEIPSPGLAGADTALPEGLRQTTAKGLRWSSLSQVTRALLRLLTTALLGRLLLPADFGVVGMAWVVVVFAGLFRDFGASAAVVQRKHLDDGLPASAFWMNVGASVVLTALLFFSAPYIAAAYGDPRVAPVLQALSFLFILSGASMMHQALLERNLAFDRLAKVEMVATVTGCTLGVACAFAGLGVWSLVIQEMSLITLTSVLLWFASPWRPGLRFAPEKLKEVSGFSLHVMGFHFLEYVAKHCDVVLIGRFVGAAALGFYTLANNLMLYPVVNVATVLQRVLFPVYSRLQDEDDKLGEAYLDAAASIAFLTFPMMLGVMAVAEPFVLTAFGPGRAEVIPLILLLAPVGLMQSLTMTTSILYLAKGKAARLFQWGLVSGGLLAVAFLVGTWWGLHGVALAYLLVQSLLFLPTFILPFRLIGLPLRRFVRAITPPLLCSLLMFAVVEGARLAAPQGIPSPILLAGLVALGILSYLLASLAFNRDGPLRLLSALRTG